MLAAAEEAINPADGAAAFEEAMRDIESLREKVVVAAQRVLDRMRMTMSVMFAVRRHLGSHEELHQHDKKHFGPPQFVLDAQAELHRRLTGIFEAAPRRARGRARGRGRRPAQPDLRGQPSRAGNDPRRSAPTRSLTSSSRGSLHGERSNQMLITLVRNFLAAYRGPLTVVVGLQFIGTVMALYLPSLNADIIDHGVVTGDTGYIVRIGAVMLVVALVQIVCSVGAVWFGARTAMGFGRDVRAAIFHRVGTFSQREVQSFGAPSLITRETNDVQQVQMLVLMSCTLMVMAPIMMVGGIVMAIHVDVGLSWLVAVTVPVLAILLGLIITRMVPSFRLMQGRIDEVNRLLREQITGVRVVRAFVREPLETERFENANSDLTASPSGPAATRP